MYRKYYKYVNWTQPVFTSATTWGNVWADNYSSGSNQYPYQALDGKTSGGNEADFAAGDSNKTVNWYWDFDYKLKITQIKIWNRGNAENYGGATTYTIYGKNIDGTYEEIGIISLPATSWVSDTVNILSSKNYEGIKIHCSGDKAFVGIGEVLLTASHIVESDESDYDFYKDFYEYKAKKSTLRHYYKYQYESWTQPNLTSTETEVQEGTIYATASSNNSSSKIYGAMDGVNSGTNQNNIWQCSNSTTGWWQVKFPYKIKITGLIHYNSYGGYSGDRWVTGQYFTSSDKITPIGNQFTSSDVNWQQNIITGIPEEGVITDTIYFYKSNGGNYSGIGEIVLTATKQILTESTSSDYDFYKDISKYKIYKKIDAIGHKSLKFEPSDSFQEWTVPEGLTKVRVDCVASKGKDYSGSGGNGGRVQCDLNVTPGQTLYFYVSSVSTAHISEPTYNATDIRTNNTGITDLTSLESRIIVAGGGGNACNHAGGGAGGGLIGGNGGSNNSGYAGVGQGGTQSSGGAGGTGHHGGQGHHHNGGTGSFGLGGGGSYEGSYEGPSGAGGAGYYGGGGGAGSWNKAGAFTAGGGGGSSYTDPNLCTQIPDVDIHTQGYNNGDGYIMISAINPEDYIWYTYGYDCKMIKQ